MKTLVSFSLLMCLLIFNSYGQGPMNTDLQKNKMPFFLNSENESLIILEKKFNKWNIKIKEKYAGEFIKDPVGFVVINFKFEDLLSTIKQPGHEFYEVTFKCEKGYLEARYSKEGRLVRIFQNFEDIPLPRVIRHKLYRDYKGWEMISNKSVATFNEESKFNRVVYRIKLKNGNQTKIVKVPSETFYFPGSIEI